MRLTFSVLLLAVMPSSGLTQAEAERLNPADGVSDDGFGYSVSVFGNHALVGMPLDDEAGFASGAAYVFERTSAGWVEVAKLTASDANSGDLFGWSVSLHGERALIGAYSHAQNAGAAYLFQRTLSGWTEVAKLTASDAAPIDVFGIAVSIEGDRVLIGAAGVDQQPITECGAAYLFEYQGGIWVEVGKIFASDPAAGDSLGISVSLSGDTALLGSYNDDVQGNDSGSAYVFVRTPNGDWGPFETAKLTPSDPAAGDRFGGSVSLDGGVAVVGSAFDDDFIFDSGAAYVFERVGAGTWGPHETVKLHASDGTFGDEFGCGVAVRGDKILVGAHEGLGFSPGAAYLFERASDGTWGPYESLRWLASDGELDDGFGFAVSLSEQLALIGAPREDDLGSDAGAAYVFTAVPALSYCFGDGSGSTCPCGNSAGPGEGCANSSSLGGVLAAEGSSSASADDLTLQASQLLPAQPCLLFAGESPVNGWAGVPFGDGLRCAGFQVVRLGVQVPDASGGARFGPGLGPGPGWSAGDVRYFQVWYRDPVGSPCGAGFNLTNGLEVVFGP